MPIFLGQIQYQQNTTGTQTFTDFSTGNLVNNQHFIQAALKLQPHPQISVALLFDQPYFVDVDYQYRPESIQAEPLPMKLQILSLTQEILQHSLAINPHNIGTSLQV